MGTASMQENRLNNEADERQAARITQQTY